MEVLNGVREFAEAFRAAPHLFVYAAIGGVLPALLWLWFWLKEDNLHPEPRRLVFLTFFAGMLSVLAVLPVQVVVKELLDVSVELNNLFKTNPAHALLFLTILAFLEEIFKFFAAYAVALRKRETDEPIDTIIYLITAALGFAALENTLYLVSPILRSNLIDILLTGNFRFIGATLLHTLSSGGLGLALAFAFYKRLTIKRVDFYLGIILATILHTLFNLFIMTGGGRNVVIAFLLVWFGIVLLILLFEKVKLIRAQ